VTFVTLPIPCNGYALRMLKQVTVVGAELTMTMQVVNVGEKEITLSEYCHNFVSIDKLPLGPGYRLAFQSIVDQADRLSPNVNGTFAWRGGAFTFSAYNPGAAMVDLAPADILPSSPFSWELSHAASPARLRETDSFHPDNVAIWAIDHIISPEVFHRVTLNPGKTDRWVRTWSFTD
jgi:hypothetical protein